MREAHQVHHDVVRALRRAVGGFEVSGQDLCSLRLPGGVRIREGVLREAELDPAAQLPLVFGPLALEQSVAARILAQSAERVGPTSRGLHLSRCATLLGEDAVRVLQVISCLLNLRADARHVIVLHEEHGPIEQQPPKVVARLGVVEARRFIRQLRERLTDLFDGLGEAAPLHGCEGKSDRKVQAA